MQILLLDNYDSFTYNLVQLVEETGLCTCKIVKNDHADAASLHDCDGILLSPGPDLPANSGKLLQVIQLVAGYKPILGVCLGHQAIAQTFGALLFNLGEPVHGITSKTRIIDQDETIFKNFPLLFDAGRYHSWAVGRENFPDCLSVTAESEDGVIMAFSHKTLNIKGIQFHPESFMTPLGALLMKNWLLSLKSCKS